LLWVWVICVVLTLDLFLNVDEVDAIRPRAKLYRGMRIAAHKMVGEPYDDEDLGLLHSRPSGPSAARDTDAVTLTAVREAGSFSTLQGMSEKAEDPQVRLEALRVMVDRFGTQALSPLVRSAFDDSESDEIRAQAARLLGRIGFVAPLDEILRSELPPAVQAGAILGLGELGTSETAKRVLAMADGTPSVRRTAALRAIPLLSSKEAAPLLMEVASDPHLEADTRMAACQGLVAGKQVEAVRTFSGIVTYDRNPPAVRAAAVEALGLLGERDALDTVAKACEDPSPEVARQARIAKKRLSRVPAR